MPVTIEASGDPNDSYLVVIPISETEQMWDYFPADERDFAIMYAYDYSSQTADEQAFALFGPLEPDLEYVVPEDYTGPELPKRRDLCIGTADERWPALLEEVRDQLPEWFSNANDITLDMDKPVRSAIKEARKLKKRVKAPALESA